MAHASNATNEDQCPPISDQDNIDEELKTQSIIIFCVYSVLMIIGLFGNGYTCFRIFRKKHMSRFMIFLSSLAFADLLSSFFFPMLFFNDLLAAIIGDQWYLGAALCSSANAVTPFLLTASTWSLVAISIERLRVVFWPLSGTERKRTAWLSLIGVWCFALLIATPSCLTWRLQCDLCMEFEDYLTPSQVFAYFITVTVVIWMLPCFIVSIVYMLIARELKRSEVQHANNQAMAIKIRQNKHIIRMFKFLVVLFCVLSLPYAVFFCILRFIRAYRIDILHREEGEVLKHLRIWNTIFFASCLLNSVINPLIYAKMHPRKNRIVRRWFSSMVSTLNRCHTVGGDYALRNFRSQEAVTERYIARATSF